MSDLTSQELAVIAKVEKLLALAKSANEHEAALAQQKATELLEAYNLDMAVVSKDKPVHAKREDTKLKGGLYQWQRELWNAVAQVNFCLYRYHRGLSKGSSYEHQLIGSKVNVLSTKLMADYLQGAVERLGQNWAKDRGYHSVFVKEAIAYREGMSERLVDRLRDIRRKREREAHEARKAQGNGDGRALALISVVQSEDDLNTDHIYGLEPGTTARQRHESELRRAAAEKAAAEMLASILAAELANPALKEAREKKEAEEKAERDRQYEKWKKKWDKQLAKPIREKQKTNREKRREMGSFHHGYSDGADVSLDRQITQNETRRLK